MVSAASYQAEYNEKNMSRNLLSHNIEIEVEYWAMEEIERNIKSGTFSSRIKNILKL